MNLYGAALFRNHPNTVAQTRSFFASFGKEGGHGATMPV